MNQLLSTAVSPGGTDFRSNGSLDRAMHMVGVLQHLGPGPHSFAALIEETGLPKTSARRILKTALRRRLIQQPAHGRYEVGPALQQLDTLAALPGSSPAIKGHLALLQSRTGQVAVLHQHLLGTSMRICVDVALGARKDFVAALSPEGGAALLRARLHHRDAAGLVILANLVDGPGPDGIFQSVRTEGYAVTGAPVAGWLMLSVPLWRANGVVGSVSVLAPVGDVVRQGPEMARVTAEAAAAISHELGGTRAVRPAIPILRSVS